MLRDSSCEIIIPLNCPTIGDHEVPQVLAPGLFISTTFWYSLECNYELLGICNSWVPHPISGFYIASNTIDSADQVLTNVSGYFLSGVIYVSSSLICINFIPSCWASRAQSTYVFGVFEFVNIFASCANYKIAALAKWDTSPGFAPCDITAVILLCDVVLCLSTCSDAWYIDSVSVSCEVSIYITSIDIHN
jgi:hypothetical protein